MNGLQQNKKAENKGPLCKSSSMTLLKKKKSSSFVTQFKKRRNFNKELAKGIYRGIGAHTNPKSKYFGTNVHERGSVSIATF